MSTFRILGLIEVWAGERLLAVGGPTQIKVLACLLVQANRAVSGDVLVDCVWGASRSGGDNRLQMAVARLRKALEPLADDGREPVLRTVSGGYLLVTGPDGLDAEVFERRVREGRQAFDAHELERAVERLDAALGLWRGPALAEVAFEDFAQSEIRRLEELRVVALETRAEAKSQLGDHGELIGELQTLVSAHPEREQLTAQLMRALYRCGRQAEALEVYQRLRTRLADELGLEPGPALRELQAQILAQAAELDLSAAPSLPFPGHDRELPTGTVTFMFTDIEGSTALVREIGPERYGEVLTAHRRQVREAIAGHRGIEVGTEGDAFFVVFARASDALRAASTIQAELTEGPLRLRVGIHTGQPLVIDGDYVGLDVHKAARICAAGHGGQVLVSQATQALTGDGLRDLGEYRLKDLTAPERLYQLGSSEFPPLRTLRQTNLPVQPSLLLGRRQELSDLLRWAKTSRLLTLTGPGGTGKTRLALELVAQLSEHFRDGVWWVPLAAVTDPGLVLATIAQHLGVRGDLHAHLAGKHALLLLDNLEQVLAAAPLIAELLASLPDLTVVATSRERLALAGEQEYPVPPLDQAAATELFTARARQLRPDFQPDEAVAELCNRLDRLPLALELVSSRIKVLSPVQILQRIEHRLDLLIAGTRDAPARQMTMRSAIGWSFDLLPESEQTLFRRLSVFAGSFDLNAAEAICHAELDAIQSLVEKSLVRSAPGGRFFLLETTREYALEQLIAFSEREALQRQHAEYFLRVAHEAGRHIWSADQAEWFQRLEAETDNLRTVLVWCAHQDPAKGIDLAAILVRPSRMHGRLSELVAWLEPVLSSLPDIDAPTRARGLNVLGEALNFLDEFGRARAALDESLNLARESQHTKTEADALRLLGMISANKEQWADAEASLLAALSLSRRADDYLCTSRILNLLGACYLGRGDVNQARVVWQEALELATGVGDLTLVTANLGFLGDLALDTGKLREAAGHYRHAMKIDQLIEDQRNDIYSLAGLACVAALEEERYTAGRFWAVAQAAELALGIRMLAAERRRYERIMYSLHDDTEFHAGQRDGRGTTLADVVREILGEP